MTRPGGARHTIREDTVVQGNKPCLIVNIVNDGVGPRIVIALAVGAKAGDLQDKDDIVSRRL